MSSLLLSLHSKINISVFSDCSNIEGFQWEQDLMLEQGFWSAFSLPNSPWWTPWGWWPGTAPSKDRHKTALGFWKRCCWWVNSQLGCSNSSVFNPEISVPHCHLRDPSRCAGTTLDSPFGRKDISLGSFFFLGSCRNAFSSLLPGEEREERFRWAPLPHHEHCGKKIGPGRELGSEPGLGILHSSCLSAEKLPVNTKALPH